MNSGKEINEEAQLWVAFKKGDQKAYERIYSAYYPILYNYGYKYIRNTHLVTDLIHDLFLKLWTSRERLSDPASIKNYLFKSFRGHLFNHSKASKNIFVGDGNQLNDFNIELNDSPESNFIADEQMTGLRKKIGQALQKLTDRQREVIYLRYYEEFSYPEIAEIMGLTLKGTYKLMGRAIETLRSQESIGNIILFLITQKHFYKNHLKDHHRLENVDHQKSA
ncbi:RNA polymerase sigma factor [Solitalea canadensis]|uniref:RNA polymerase sigma factor, sigma-70 family n=1 Tax=Solitalea canadensis (strain ATCC 29591 / DSM 3403 / JCM 21819 / LMG 8368 / NBRC 15130 / NCIMB 12057 / USAM 9D) TaxID=929556 RepID=H8KP74_SOLCM|nr:sigma-70 family RNA polymerase sigma factor [Solitalea canadensis]AFD05711.1 RNA polymerase sigma factor, sigma-70 family [Solitalea canadensis DSM 3403]